MSVTTVQPTINPSSPASRPGPRRSELQKHTLIILAAREARVPGPVLVTDISAMMSRAGLRIVYGGNLRESCRRMEKQGLVRTLRARNLQLAVELTEAGRKIASQLLDTGND